MRYISILALLPQRKQKPLTRNTEVPLYRAHPSSTCTDAAHAHRRRDRPPSSSHPLLLHYRTQRETGAIHQRPRKAIRSLQSDALRGHERGPPRPCDPHQALTGSDLSRGIGGKNLCVSPARERFWPGFERFQTRFDLLSLVSAI